MARRATSLGPNTLLICFFLVFLFCFFVVVFFRGFKGQVRWPEGPPHLALNPPYLLLLFSLFCFLFFVLFFFWFFFVTTTKKPCFPPEKGIF